TGDLTNPAPWVPLGSDQDREYLIVILGMPWFLLSTMLAHALYLLLNSMSQQGDVEREWLGRASGWHLIAGFSWIMLSAIVLIGPKMIDGVLAHVLTIASGGATGAATGILGKSALTSVTGKSSSWKGFAVNLGL